ncbi:uncharacterized protein LOC134835383 [Culicoides brevitarsis]|uniref:uncharacterized protein LOC134835383 n=1 Tax=Culicoides brevitarsis TaxID=469753 RepID=UPI00307BB057
MVVVEMYCREQIAIPEQLPLILKKYAKAVIRTQPYDLLRWSAAYFRCLALEHVPPAKLRFEPDQNYGSLTRGYVRTLLEQLGKGYFVKRELLLNVWQGLCLPEEQLYDFLSLCRMLHWSQVHWLKLIAVMIGALNKDLPGTMKMICEVLTDEPEGSPAPIPLWMFRVCYKFVAELDCSDTQCFIDGQKLLPGDVLEEEEEVTEPPQVHKAAIFQQLLIDEWKSRMKYDDFAAPETLDSQSKSETDPETASILPRVSSSFKFVGNFADPAEVLRRTPDFESVILLLQEEIENIQNECSSKKVEEILEKRQKCDRETKIAENDKNEEYLSKIGAPWTWISSFSDHNCPERSFNFIDDSVKAPEEFPAEECCTVVDSKHFTGDESRSKTFIYDSKSRNSSRSFSRGSEAPEIAKKEEKTTDKIVEIFEESGFDVDNKLLEKKFSETMILGLVQKPATTPPGQESEAPKSLESKDTTIGTVAMTSQDELQTKDETSQTTPMKEREKLSETSLQKTSTQGEKESNVGPADELHKSILPPLPGIGPSVSLETSERFLLYLMRRARQQGGMVFPRNWQEHDCPPMTD